MWELLVLVTLDGREISVSPRHIVSIAEAKQADDPGKHYTDKVRCVISVSDGTHVTTEEECESIEQRLQEMAARRIQELRK